MQKQQPMNKILQLRSYKVLVGVCVYGFGKWGSGGKGFEQFYVGTSGHPVRQFAECNAMPHPMFKFTFTAQALDEIQRGLDTRLA